MSQARHFWINKRMPIMNKHLNRLVFLDETSTNTKLTKRTGWAPVGQRLYDHVPFGHWKTQTFIAGLRQDGLTAPWVLDGPMNGRAFECYIETQLAPTLKKGDVVILDNVAFHKSQKAAQTLKDIGAWFVFLPPYSPDLNPIEMAFSKIKAHLRKACARSYDQVWKSIGNIVKLFKPDECTHFFKAAGYEFIDM